MKKEYQKKIEGQLRNELAQLRLRITELEASEAELKQSQQNAQTLTHRLIKDHESERRRVSYYLHENVAQYLCALKIFCETIFDSRQNVPDEIRQKATEMSTTVRGCIEVARDLSYDLRDPVLDQLGLVHTVFRYCQEFSDKNKVNVDFFSSGLDDLKLDIDTEINLYRVVQEALSNISKHADAGHVAVRLLASFLKVILSIEDDGKGFDIENRSVAELNEKQIGLQNMRERVGLLEGKMKIQSRPMQGTKIYIEVPFKEKPKLSV